MADPFYGAAPRQESTVVRTNDEFEHMRRERARKISEKAKQERDRAREGNAYWQSVEARQAAPSLAEFMYHTGANVDQANRILNTYGDAANYAPEGGWGQKDLSAIQAEMNSGRQAPEFQWNFSQPDTAGQIMPSYTKFGDGDIQQSRWLMTSGSGESPLTIGRGHDKQRLYEDAMGMGVGQAGLDAFAKQFGYANFQSMPQYAIDAQAGAFKGGKYQQGYLDNTYRRDPSLWGGDYVMATSGSGVPGTVYRQDGSTSSVHDLPGSMWQSQQDFFGINDQYRAAHAPIRAMNQDFASSMAQRNEANIRNEQGYDALTGYGNGGLLDENYSNPFFGQITGREAPQSPFTTPDQKYPWSLPTQQLDLASLMSPGYGGPTGSGSMGAYGGSGWGNQGQNKFGGMGGLGGFQAGPFGAKNPWSPS